MQKLHLYIIALILKIERMIYSLELNFVNSKWMRKIVDEFEISKNDFGNKNCKNTNIRALAQVVWF